jgi:hypothetical protein
MLKMEHESAEKMEVLPKECRSEIIKFISDIKNNPSYFNFNPVHFKNGKIPKGWKIHYGLTLTGARHEAGDAADEAAGHTARPEIWDAEYNAALDAMDVGWDKSWDKVLDAVEDAVWYATRHVPLDVRIDAVHDALLMAKWIIMKNNPKFKDKAMHTKNINKRMDAWRKGHCVLTDVNDDLYVYCECTEEESAEIREALRKGDVSESVPITLIVKENCRDRKALLDSGK